MSAPPAPRPAPVEVVAAVIGRADGSFLLAQRPPGKVYAGYWEFPGGKVEAGEPLRAALRRELREELGIEVARAYPWIVQHFVYPHAHVRLNFFRVSAWEGEPQPLEDQALAWTRAQAPNVGPMLPANAPVLKALALPAMVGITCAAQIGTDALLERLDAALARGLRLVMIRERGMGPAELASFGREVIARCRATGARSIVNADPALAAVIGADGVHLPARELMQIAARPPVALCGASCHDARELRRAQALGVDYALVGPVCETPSHPGQPGMGWDAFAGLIAGSPMPVFAIGGMERGDLERAWEAGAHGVAMIRGAWGLTGG